MMLLYVCKQCGRWQDATIVAAIARAAAAFSQVFSGAPGTVDAPADMRCPDGHGLMTLVGPRDKLFVWAEGDERALSPSGLHLVAPGDEGEE